MADSFSILKVYHDTFDYSLRLRKRSLNEFAAQTDPCGPHDVSQARLRQQCHREQRFDVSSFYISGWIDGHANPLKQS